MKARYFLLFTVSASIIKHANQTEEPQDWDEGSDFLTALQAHVQKFFSHFCSDRKCLELIWKGRVFQSDERRNKQ